MDAATLLREARRAAGLTQAELAARAATSQATLSAYERGRKSPSAATLIRILSAGGQELTTRAADRPVITPGRAALATAGETLRDVLGLAEQLPTSHADDQGFPGLPPPPAGA